MSIIVSHQKYELGDFIIVLTDYHANGAYKKLKQNVELLDQPNYAVMIRTTNFEKDDFTNNLKYINERAYEFLRKSKVQQGDILMNKIANAGSVYRMPDLNRPVSLAMNLFLIRVDENKINQSYVYYWLKVNEPYVKSFANGAATQTITKQAVKELKLDVIEREQQEKIVEILDTYQKAIENNNRRIAILEGMAQSLYREWFVHFHFPGHENCQFKDSELGRIPEGWEVRTIKDFGEIITGKTPSKKKEEYYNSHDIPFIKTPDMHGDIFVIETIEKLSFAGAESQKKKTLPIGSISVSCIGTAGVVAINAKPAQTNQQINSVILNNENEREFLYFSLCDLKQTIINYGSTGATMTNLSKGKFESLKVLYPAEEKISEFSTFVKSKFEMVLNLMKKNNNLKIQRDMLLPKLISGGIKI